MHKRVIASVAALALVAVSANLSVAARKPRPYKSETVTIQYGKWAPHNPDLAVTVTVTAAEFLARCAIPETTQGLDAWVFEVPKAYRNIPALIQTSGRGKDLGGADYYDIDIYVYDADCTQTAAFLTNNEDEMGLLPKGSAFILLNNYSTTAAGASEVSFELTPDTGPPGL